MFFFFYVPMIQLLVTSATHPIFYFLWRRTTTPPSRPLVSEPDRVYPSQRVESQHGQDQGHMQEKREECIIITNSVAAKKALKLKRE